MSAISFWIWPTLKGDSCSTGESHFTTRADTLSNERFSNERDSCMTNTCGPVRNGIRICTTPDRTLYPITHHAAKACCETLSRHQRQDKPNCKPSPVHAHACDVQLSTMFSDHNDQRVPYGLFRSLSPKLVTHMPSGKPLPFLFSPHCCDQQMLQVPGLSFHRCPMKEPRRSRAAFAFQHLRRPDFSTLILTSRPPQK